MFHADEKTEGRTGRHDQANSHPSQLRTRLKMHFNVKTWVYIITIVLHDNHLDIFENSRIVQKYIEQNNEKTHRPIQASALLYRTGLRMK